MAGVLVEQPRKLVPTWVFRQAYGMVKIHIRWNIKKGWLKS